MREHAVRLRRGKRRLTASEQRRRSEYPCGYATTRIVCVAATTNRTTRASYSNYGATSVDLAAPGVGAAARGSAILSTFPRGAGRYDQELRGDWTTRWTA